MMADVIDLQAWKGKLVSSSKGGPKKTITNLMICLQNIRELGNTIRWNELAQRAEWNGLPIEDSHLVDIRLILEANHFEPTVGDVLPAVLRHAKDNAFHPIRDYLRGLKWDGTPRIDRWLDVCLGVPDSRFARAVGRKTLIAAAARAFKPGCKVDTMLVLEGPQGLRKSSAIAALFGEAYTAESVNLFDQHNKMVLSMMGAWVVELAEFVAITRRDENQVKGMITMRSDRVVLPYAKMASDHPRQCVFFGTINPGESGYLTDATGNRRYWPVSVSKVDLDKIEANRDQMWAEAYRCFLAGEPWWLDEGEEVLAANAVAAREEYDVWVDILGDKLAGRTRITPDGALTELGIPNERKDRKTEQRVSKAMQRLGFKLHYPKDAQRHTYREWRRDGP